MLIWLSFANNVFMYLTGFELLITYFTLTRNHSGKIVKFVNINVYANFYEIVSMFHRG